MEVIECKGRIQLIRVEPHFLQFGAYNVFAGGVCIGQFVPNSEYAVNRFQNAFDIAAEMAVRDNDKIVGEAKRLKEALSSFLSL